MTGSGRVRTRARVNPSFKTSRERSQGPVFFLHTHTGALVGVEITPAVLKEIKQAVDSYERWTNKTVDFGMPANALAVPKPTKKLLSLVFFDENGKFVRTP